MRPDGPALHGGPVVLHPVRATPCFISLISFFFTFSHARVVLVAFLNLMPISLCLSRGGVEKLLIIYLLILNDNDALCKGRHSE